MRHRHCVVAGLLIATLWQLGSVAGAQEVVSERLFQLVLAPGWARWSEALPQGFDIGFRKQLAVGRSATLFLHCESMPETAGQPPADASDIQAQFGQLIAGCFPDAQLVESPAANVVGRTLVNQTYNLTDGGVQWRRRYLYFISQRIAFVVACSSSPTDWSAVAPDFEVILPSISPKTGAVAEKITCQAAVQRMKQELPTFFASFPEMWRCSFRDIKVVSADAPARSGLEMSVVFGRPDIGKVYAATRAMMAAVRNGPVDDQNLPAEARQVGPESITAFVKYVGETFGIAYYYVANCDPQIDGFSLMIVDDAGQKIGAVSISRPDLMDVLSGKVSATDTQRLFGMYRFD